MIEALACGVPVAGYPVPGPLDVVGPDGRGPYGELAQPVGAVDDNLGRAIMRACRVDRVLAARYGESFTWNKATDQFMAAIFGAAGDVRDVA